MSQEIQQERTFTPPPDGFYKCCACGALTPGSVSLSYEEQAACNDDDCFGQNFCNKWPGWSVNGEEGTTKKSVLKKVLGNQDFVTNSRLDITTQKEFLNGDS